jgi:hypothetical protein
MTQAFDRLKALLEEKGTLGDEEIVNTVREHGALTAEENSWLQAELHERQRAAQSTVTTEQFLAANKVLDTAEPDSEEYKTAQQTVDRFLGGN